MSSVECPFIPGKRYVVKRDYEFLNHRLRAGDIATFSTFAYEAKGGVTRFWFETNGGSSTDVWHVWDHEPTAAECWHEYFEEAADV
jgi:hypothetical protein